MKKIPLLTPSLSSDEVTCWSEELSPATIAKSVHFAAESTGAPNPVEGHGFKQRLEDAETEARSMNETWKRAARKRQMPERDSRLDSDGITNTAMQQAERKSNNVQGQYDYDIQSADEEVLSNVKEVQRFNAELIISEEEAHFIDKGLGPANESEHHNSDSGHDFDLITSIIEVVREPLIILDNALRVRKANRAFYRTFSHPEKETETRSIYELAHGAWNIPALKVLLEKVLLDNRAYEEVEVESEFPQVGRKTLRLNVRRLSGGEMILMSIRDVTPRRRTEVEVHRLQDELRQGQKMEVIGRLAGGVAHDFNNILTGIMGFSELLMDDLEAGTDAFYQAAEIKKASERAAALTQQLLAFSRRQVLRPQVINLNTVILGLTEILRRLIGDHIELYNALDERLGSVCADPGQLSQIILNLAVNARDAMPQGGRLSIRTENARADGVGKELHGLDQDEHVRLTVTDTGMGMDYEIQQHVFEPFFTTKPQGSGTGLGLATVFGIVTQSGGDIQFVSEPECGTTFWIDFPRIEGSTCDEERTSVEIPPERATILVGSETVLVVEDDDLVRELVVLILKRRGYTVLDVNQPSQALTLCQSYPLQIHLMLTDLLMPGGVDGRELAEQAIRIRPGIRVLLMSGYTTDALVLYGVSEGAPFLQKPFTQQQLTGKVRDVLDAKSTCFAAN